MVSNYTIQKLLEKSFKESSECTAIRYKGREYTYQNLEGMVDRYAGIIVKMAADCDIVAVMIEDRLETICAILGIVKLGKCFLPINPEYPMPVISQMLRVSPGLILTDTAGIAKLQSIQCELPCTDCSNEQDPICEKSVLWAECDEQSMLYIYFTSGTTGRPKGIVGKNIGLFQFVTWEIKQFSMHRHYTFSQFTPVCHDPFLRDLFTPLSLGASIAIPEGKENIIDGKRLRSFIQDENISVIHATPSLLRILLQGNALQPDAFPNLRYLLLAGERLDSKLLSLWYEAIGNRVQIVNLYGPTETTLAKLYYMVSPDDIKRNSIPIGKPMSGAQALILDNQMNICTHGMEGEIYIRTPYMSLGYYDDEAANAERFIKNPYSKTGDCSDLIFRTGDLGRVLTDGNIEILGRTDRQIKIRGFRVELDAIESELARFPAVACCAVKHFEPEDASIIIVGYYVSENEISNSELSNHLRRCLPDYMCPSGFIKIDKLPVTRNNKTDYAALLLPDILSDSDYEPPATTLECEIEKIWCEILKKSRFSMEDDFLQGGGNSLNTMTMINSIYEKYGYELPLVAVFSGITVRQLAQLLEQNVSDPGQAEMGDVEDFIIAHTKMDARYIKVISPGSELRVLFMHAALSDELLKAIRDEFDRSLHPHYIEAMCEQAVTMPDVIKISNEELITLLSLKQNYDISEIGLGELYAQNDLLNSMIMSSSTSRKREFSVAQVVRTYVPELNSTTFILHGLIDLKALERAFCDVINSEALLRCAMVNGKSFLEYPEVDETMPLPMLDLCDYTPQCCRRIISDGLMPKFLLKEFAKNDALQWRALGVKLNHSETLFYFFANHIIFDGFSRQIFKDALLSGYARHTGRSTAMVSDKTSSYFDFNDHVRRHMAEKGLPEWVIPYESFKNHSNMLRQKMNGEQSVQKITIDMRPVFAQHPDVTKDDLMAKTAYSVFTGSIAQCFRCEMIPFVTISDGRRFGEHSCYSHIGEFIDYIPYLGCNTDQDFLDYSAYLTRIEIEGVSILESLGVSSRSKISHMKLYNFMRSIPVVYNYQHYRVAESEEESSSFTDDVGPQKPSFINFIVRPRQDALEFLVVSPCKIEICTEKDGSK